MLKQLMNAHSVGVVVGVIEWLQFVAHRPVSTVYSCSLNLIDLIKLDFWYPIPLWVSKGIDMGGIEGTTVCIKANAINLL